MVPLNADMFTPCSCCIMKVG